MCIGVPLQVQSVDGDGDFALCADGDVQERLDLRLVGPQPVGTWVLSFQGAARRVLDAEQAAQIRAALQALHAALIGDAASIDVLFADLVDREPQLPPHLVIPNPKLH
ncbi:MAG: HypC/HybG/HupF family hydrogenase formation chaperone [Burkholderiales bacterium]|nr:HypC/HybG/HupF family hydrogenase formation chaperone [Burkholderiales bacterium]